MLKVHSNSVFVSLEVQRAKARTPSQSSVCGRPLQHFWLTKAQITAVYLQQRKRFQKPTDMAAPLSKYNVSGCKMMQPTLGNSEAKRRKQEDFRQPCPHHHPSSLQRPHSNKSTCQFKVQAGLEGACTHTHLTFHYYHTSITQHPSKSEKGAFLLKSPAEGADSPSAPLTITKVG